METRTILIRVPIDKINICKNTLFHGVSHKPRIEYGYFQNALDVYRILKWQNAYEHVQFFLKNCPCIV